MKINTPIFKIALFIKKKLQIPFFLLAPIASEFALKSSTLRPIDFIRIYQNELV
jgi:hypothetical protein